MNNSENRLQDVFFYGLYMDPEILKDKGVDSRNPRIAVVHGYRLRLGNMATLLRNENGQAHGIVYSLTHEEIHQLYWGSGLDGYVAEALIAKTNDGEMLAVLCCNLLVPPAENEQNPEYREKLLKCMEKYEIPT